MKGPEYNVRNYHKPTAADRGEWLGVEIECFIPIGSLGVDVHKEDAWVHGRNQLGGIIGQYDIPRVTIKTDGSIRAESGCISYEISLVFSRKDFGPLRRLCHILWKLGARTNESCGLHVHLDCRDLYPVQALNNYGNEMVPTDRTTFNAVKARGIRLNNVLGLMKRMVDGHRLTNMYCIPVMSDGDAEGRRTAINLMAFMKHGTIEIRMHQSTISYNEIAGWTDFLYNMTRSSTEKRVENLEQFKYEYKSLPPRVLKYVTQTVEAKDALKKKTAA
jgi:hypothetical protein